MRINSVELENIRSYEGDYRNNRVEFPKGSVLLAGDIGSGKSSLLLAIEFALFGIRRGELSGEALLRRGKSTGGVRIDFTLNGENITVERRLKRETGSVRQEAGYIKINKVKREGSPEELKARVLELLGYPQEMLKKQKSLIYRYTVYTPQEQMKQIIVADSEDRLDTLRRVFGVDRYKTIRENSNILTTNIRQKRRELNVVFRDLQGRREEYMRMREGYKEVQELCQDLYRGKRRVEEELEDWRNRKRVIEEKVKLYNQYDKDVGREKQKRENILRSSDELKQEIEEREKRFEELERLRPPTEMSEEEIKREIRKVDERIERCLKDSSGIYEEIDTLLKKEEDFKRSLDDKERTRLQAEERVKNVQDNLDKLLKAKDKCPVCGKDLDEEHRILKVHDYEEEIRRNDKLSRDMAVKIGELNRAIEEVRSQVKERVSDAIIRLKGERETLENLRDKLRIFNEKTREKQRLKDENAKAIEREEALANELSMVENRIEAIEKKLEELRNVEDQRIKIEEKIEEIEKRRRETERELATREADRKNLERRLEEMEEEMERMEKAKRFWTKLGTYEEWVGSFLIPLTATIEKHYMHELKRNFEPLFIDWFNLLIDDETLTVRLADDFSPVIRQQDYDAEYENLSGGESTSVALAYRLALNKVINTMVEEIKTRDLIILDEPTDGFSDDQLDKIRDVMDELNMPQTIIVSHEPKVESYVENVIRIYKESGASRIETG